MALEAVEDQVECCGKRWCASVEMRSRSVFKQVLVGVWSEGLFFDDGWMR